jgi:hypothetical protein
MEQNPATVRSNMASVEMKLSRDGDPGLVFDRVFDSSVEGLDAQVLLDPLEEDLNFSGFCRARR